MNNYANAVHIYSTNEIAFFESAWLNFSRNFCPLTKSGHVRYIWIFTESGTKV
jgi:hypothetical protein